MWNELMTGPYEIFNLVFLDFFTFDSEYVIPKQHNHVHDGYLSKLYVDHKI